MILSMLMEEHYEVLLLLQLPPAAAVTSHSQCLGTTIVGVVAASAATVSGQDGDKMRCFSCCSLLILLQGWGVGAVRAKQKKQAAGTAGEPHVNTVTMFALHLLPML